MSIRYSKNLLGKGVKRSCYKVDKNRLLSHNDRFKIFEDIYRERNVIRHTSAFLKRQKLLVSFKLYHISRNPL
jgi:hypothetical protein